MASAIVAPLLTTRAAAGNSPVSRQIANRNFAAAAARNMRPGQLWNSSSLGVGCGATAGRSGGRRAMCDYYTMKLPPGARFSTICIHAGQAPDPGTGAIITPIFQTSTYVQDALGHHKGYEYARTQNPTRAALEHNVAAIEGGAAAFAFASGMAAIDAITTLLQSGDHVVVTDNTYGGTFRLFEKVLRKYGLDFSYVDTSRLDLVEAAMRPATKMVFVETPTNPVMRLTDIDAAASLAHRHGARLVVDNTFASPAIQRPIALGADIVVHSTTKYLNGHSDSVGGIVVVTKKEDVEWLGFVQNAAGAILSPFDSWLVLRGTKTLTVRMAQHNVNGLALAEHLASHAKVKSVLYPGLPDHPQHALARKQMRGFGGMLTFDAGSFEAARAVCNRVKLMALAESLGGVETLICHPASMTHASVPPERRQAIGLADSMVRISAGIEDAQDLIDDLDQALAAL
jgi:cystathionine beta-lyase/cystathionine gamma-synthase